MDYRARFIRDDQTFVGGGDFILGKLACHGPGFLARSFIVLKFLALCIERAGSVQMEKITWHRN